MALANGCKVEHLVVDSGAFIRNIEFKDIGQKIYCVREVVNEIRDKNTRERLQVLPYDITFREPTPEAYQAVVDFSKKTGDFVSLSAVDLRLLALVHQLEKENVGLEHVRKEPVRQVQYWETKRDFENPAQIAGFYLGGKKKSSKNNSSSSGDTETNTSKDGDDNGSETEKTQGIKPDESEAEAKKLDGEEIEQTTVDSEPKVEGSSEQNTEKATDIESKNDVDKNGESDEKTSENEKNNDDNCNGIEKGENQDGEEKEDDCEGDEDEDDDEDWITPDNISSLKLDNNYLQTQPADVIPVACLTTDFAMQNVLLQMGLNVVSVEGLLIKRAKSYVFRCYSCYKVTTDMTKVFCPKCGYSSLRKVSMSVNDDGSIVYYLSKKKRFTALATNSMYSADQKTKQIQQSKRSQVKYNAFDPDYVIHDSPFAPNDLNSRSAAIRFKGQNNSGKNKKHGRRK